MDCDLTMDTDGIRRAAALLDEARRIYRVEHDNYLDFWLPDGALGTSPVARDAVARVRARTIQAIELTSRLADAAADTVASLRHSADGFDRIELECRAGG